MKKIWIYPQDANIYSLTTASNVYEISQYIVNDYDSQARCDDAFAITSFKCLIPESAFSLAKFNIAPFTIFEMGEQLYASDNQRFFGYSKCTKYLRPQNGVTYYVHEITLLEPLALLEAIQIGTKTFTNHYDNNYLRILSTLIYRKTGYEINFTGTWSVVEPHSFSFDKGTTAFEIANEIFRLHNYKMEAEITITSYPYANFIMNVSPIDLDNIEEVDITDYTDLISLVEYNQSMDDYCKHLESQVDNVIDRNTLTTWTNLTVRSNDNYADSDNCYIELPAKVEEVTNLEATVPCIINISFNISNSDAIAIMDANGTNYNVNVSYALIVSCCSWVGVWFEALKELYPNFHPENHTYNFEDPTGTGTTYTTVVNEDYGDTQSALIDISDYVLDSIVYNALTPAQRVGYCYYTSGDNKIQGIYEYYKDNWIYTILGVSQYPFLTQINSKISFTNTSDHIIYEDDSTYASITYSYRTSDANPINTLFNASARPITNQYVDDIKSSVPINALNSVGYIGTARSYGNSANFIDYDIMRKNISISNKSLGTPELTIEFVNECPLDTNTKFTYDSETWYVKSVITKILKDKITYTVNASNDYNKQADSIGVRTQYEATKIDLNNIKERHIYYKNDNTTMTFESSTAYYLYVTCYASDSSTIISQIMLPLSIYYNSDTGVTLVAQTIDNYSCGTQLTNQSSDRFVVSDVPYVDDAGEIYSVTLQVGIIDDMTIDKSRILPAVVDGWSNYLTIATQDVIYKDEHEQLTFTIYLPNASYE